MEIKTCGKCKIEKTIDSFWKRSKSPVKYYSYCISCKNDNSKKNLDKYLQDDEWIEKRNEYNKEYNEKNSEYIKEYSKQYFLKNQETIKEKRKESNKNNREKSKEYAYLYRLIPGKKEEIYSQRKIYNQKNRDTIREYSKKWEKENRDHLNKRSRTQYETNHNHRTRMLISSRIRSALDGKTKPKGTIEILGCSIEEFKIYLESSFLPEMTWENHGDIWEIDHILPCASFDFTQDGSLEKCFHYSNHQPLFKTTEIAESFGYTDQIGNRNKGKKLL
jgi:hypothetical protein